MRSWFPKEHVRSVSKETYVCEKQCMYVKRDLRICKETYQVRICSGGGAELTQKGRAQRVSKETYVCEKRHMYMERDISM